MDTINPNAVIDGLGGTARTAELCELTTGAVSQWRQNGIPKPWVKFLSEMRPDLFGRSCKPSRNSKSA
jgi:hypothetical protein